MRKRTLASLGPLRGRFLSRVRLHLLVVDLDGQIQVVGGIPNHVRVLHIK